VDRVNCQLPRMADLYAGPNTPLSKAFIFCGLETISVDWMLDSSHDLSNSSGSNHCMINCNQFVLLQRPWIALPRVEPGRFLVISATGDHHPDR